MYRSGLTVRQPKRSGGGTFGGILVSFFSTEGDRKMANPRMSLVVSNPHEKQLRGADLVVMDGISWLDVG